MACTSVHRFIRAVYHPETDQAEMQCELCGEVLPEWIVDVIHVDANVISIGVRLAWWYEAIIRGEETRV